MPGDSGVSGSSVIAARNVAQVGGACQPNSATNRGVRSRYRVWSSRFHTSHRWTHPWAEALGATAIEPEYGLPGQYGRPGSSSPTTRGSRSK